jgi:hypothetical protein
MLEILTGLARGQQSGHVVVGANGVREEYISEVFDMELLICYRQGVSRTEKRNYN